MVTSDSKPPFQLHPNLEKNFLITMLRFVDFSRRFVDFYW